MNTTDDANLQQTKDEGYGSKPGWPRRRPSASGKEHKQEVD
jgi:hypothetical protein